jgi:hypothetical protein
MGCAYRMSKAGSFASRAAGAVPMSGEFALHHSGATADRPGRITNKAVDKSTDAQCDDEQDYDVRRVEGHPNYLK